MFPPLTAMQFTVQNRPDYLIGSLFFIAAWVLLWWRAPRSRPVILWSSLALLPVGFLLESVYIRDYWQPEHWWYVQWGWLRLSLEDLVFTFFCSGVCAGIFDVLHRRYSRAPDVPRVTWQSAVRLFGGGLIFLLLMLALWVPGSRAGWQVGLFKMHSVNAHALACTIIIPCFFFGRSWFRTAAASLVAGAVFMILFYAGFYLRLYPTVFERWWDLDALSGLRPFTVLIEEIYWMATTTMFLGALTRFSVHLDEKGRWLTRRHTRERCQQFQDWRERRKQKPPPPGKP